MRCLRWGRDGNNPLLLQVGHLGLIQPCCNEPRLGILGGMTSTTIKVPKQTRDRLHRLASADGLTLAQAIDKLIDEHAPRPKPHIGGFRSRQPITAEQIDDELAAGFGA